MPNLKLINNTESNYSFQVRNDHYPQHHNLWHYHEELEFIYINEGSGTLFIGDCIRPFSKGNSVLIGSNVPHYWLFDEEYLQDNSKQADVYVIHFKQNFAGNFFLQLPEMKSLKTLFEESSKGLFCVETSDKLIRCFKKIITIQDIERLISLIESLDLFDKAEHKTELVSVNYHILHQHQDYQRMNLVMNFIKENFKRKIDLDEIANLSGMVKNSFCRYFKQKTGKTLSEFIAEIRIAYACKLLIEQKLSIKECCYESGFNNFVSFHSTFKKITKLTPNMFKSAHKN